LKTSSQLRRPASGGRLPFGPIPLGGLAFAGDRGISHVEVSVDDEPWQPALIRPALSPYTWVLWSTDLTAISEGRHTVRVRATDGKDNLQIEPSSGSAPSGATGYHRISFTVLPNPMG